jgi:methyl coenzyme M reductase subunit C-like uncharacterized protein (methanogenesis marker protein 7)
MNIYDNKLDKQAAGAQWLNDWHAQVPLAWVEMGQVRRQAIISHHIPHGAAPSAS